jgi:hypothetical protein
VDRSDEVGTGGDQLVEDGALRHAAGEEEGAHRPVGQQRAGREAVRESAARIHLQRSLAEHAPGSAQDDQPSDRSVPRRRPTVSAPSIPSRICGGRGRPL